MTGCSCSSVGSNLHTGFRQRAFQGTWSGFRPCAFGHGVYRCHIFLKERASYIEQVIPKCGLLRRGGRQGILGPQECRLCGDEGKCWCLLTRVCLCSMRRQAGHKKPNRVSKRMALGELPGEKTLAPQDTCLSKLYLGFHQDWDTVLVCCGLAQGHTL